MDLCAWMRNKALLGRAVITDAELELVYVRSDSPFSCNRTCQPWGPDDDLAAPETCTSARACFAPSPALRRTPLA